MAYWYRYIHGMVACPHEHLKILGVAGGMGVTHGERRLKNDGLPCSGFPGGR